MFNRDLTDKDVTLNLKNGNFWLNGVGNTYLNSDIIWWIKTIYKKDIKKCKGDNNVGLLFFRLNFANFLNAYKIEQPINSKYIKIKMDDIIHDFLLQKSKKYRALNWIKKNWVEKLCFYILAVSCHYVIIGFMLFFKFIYAALLTLW